MLKYLSVALLCVVGTFTAGAQCDSTQNTLRLEIDPDYYWYEVSWQITNLTGTYAYFDGACSSSSPEVFTYCLPVGSCFIFHIVDDYGDGMTPDGSYRLYLNDSLIHENIGGAYGFGEFVNFDCPPGSYCTDAFVVDTGLHTTPADQETWYSFTPQDTGTYKISTCGFGLACATKIWVYDRCEGITVTNNNLGTVFYADGGCTGGTEATLYLAGGKTYFIRIGYATGSCNGAPIEFNLTYTGPVVGCTDPLACNYQPLASVSDTCVYPGDPECNDLPDLVVLENVLRNTLSPDIIPNADACAVEEGCIRGFGARYVLRFTTHIKNIGVADYFIGETPASPGTPSDQFVWDPCHNHWHYRGYAEYLLFDNNGVRIPIGSKNGFCVLDLECSGGGIGKYSCSNMGITSGCGDIYDSALPCQWVDITGLQSGFYTLVVRVNWDKSPDKTGRPEVSYENNWAQACFELSYDILGTPSFEMVNDCPVFTDCTGEAFGASQPDCNGVCNGTALIGDWDQDTLRTVADVAAYSEAAVFNTAAATSCTDLELNDTIDVYDAALLQECVLHADDPQYWGTRFPCEFPGGTPNPDDIVYLLPGTLDTVAKTFDVRIVNPFSALIGFEFGVSGLTIDSVENLDPGFTAEWKFNPLTGKLFVLSAAEQGLPKHILPAAFLRVHYSELTANQVCVANIQGIVNKKYQRCNALLADPNCVSTGVSGLNELSNADLQVFAMPNPATDRFTVYFQNPDFVPVQVVLTDISGATVASIKGIRSTSATIERNGLPAGMYTYFVQTAKGRAVGKVVFK